MELSNETQALRKSVYMGIWVVGALNQQFIRGSYTEIKSSKEYLLMAKLRSLRQVYF